MPSQTARGLLLIGALKLLKALALFALGLGLLTLLQHDTAQAVRHAIESAHLDSHTRLIERLLSRVAGIDHHTLRRLGVGTLVYATVFGIEGVGLLLGKVWAEYMTTGVTISFLPFEVYELLVHPSAVKALVTLTNVAVVIYLLLEIRERRANEHLRAEMSAEQHSERASE